MNKKHLVKIWCLSTMDGYLSAAHVDGDTGDPHRWGYWHTEGFAQDELVVDIWVVPWSTVFNLEDHGYLSTRTIDVPDRTYDHVILSDGYDAQSLVINTGKVHMTEVQLW